MPSLGLRTTFANERSILFGYHRDKIELYDSTALHK